MRRLRGALPLRAASATVIAFRSKLDRSRGCSNAVRVTCRLCRGKYLQSEAFMYLGKCASALVLRLQLKLHAMTPEGRACGCSEALAWCSGVRE